MKSQVLNWRGATDCSCQICASDAKVAQDQHPIHDSVRSQRKGSYGINLAIYLHRAYACPFEKKMDLSV